MKAVIFDLFDTLVSSELPGRPSQEDAADSLRVSLDDLRHGWRDSARQRMTGEFPSYLSSLEAMGRDLGSPATDSELKAVATSRYQRKRDVLLRVEARILDMIASLASSGLRVSILRNTTEDEIASWDECPLSTMVEDVVFSCHVGAMKPDLAIYALALERLRLDASDCCFVGDGGTDELRGSAHCGVTPLRAKWYVDREVAWDLSRELPALGEPADLPSVIAGLGRPSVA